MASGGQGGAGGTSAGPLSCTLPFQAADTSTPTTVVGQGGVTCDEAGVAAAVAAGGIVTFDCGDVTITLTAPLAPPKSKDTTIDGGGHITLDGGGTSRLLSFKGGNYRGTTTRITVQHLAFQNGHATGTKLPDPPANTDCSEGYDTDAGGGDIYVQDGELRVFDCTFSSSSGQTPGPDVAGGAIYVDGSLGATIVQSTFTNNTASNGGAIGSLNSDLAVYTSTFTGNSATGTGQNTIDQTHCSSASGEVGDGGSGGAIYMDGGSEGDVTFCGDIFSKNHANALGGVFFRVFDTATHNLTIDLCTMDSNVADGPVGRTGSGPGAGAYYAEKANLSMQNSTVSNNSSPGCGGVQSDGSTLTFINDTFAGNTATSGVGGALCFFSNSGTITNSTFANNQALGGTDTFSNYYGASIFGNNLTIDNTIFDNNTTQNDDGRMSCGNTFTGSHDVQWPSKKVVGGSADSPCVTGITFADAMVGALANNGGTTQTMLPGASASVVQIGTNCPATDQTGKPRKSPCTIGAVEAQ